MDTTRTLYRQRDADGIVEVVEDATTRTLYFGSNARQSCLLLTDPVALVLSYTRAMLAALLFREDPQRVLLIGLGGGSLARFLLHHFPACHLQAAEPRAAVIDVARTYFALPVDDRLQIAPVDGAAFLAGPARDGGPYDLILVDAYDRAGMAPGIDSEEFYAACREVLAPDGVLAVNLWATGPGGCRDSLRHLRQTLDGPVLRLPVERRGNVIALGLRRRLPAGALTTLQPWARRLQQRHGLDFPALLRNLQRHNGGLLQRLLG